MLPDSEITKNYRQSETKIKYSIQYGIVSYLTQKLIYNVKDNLLLLNSMKLPTEMYQSNMMHIYNTGPKVTIKL